MSLISSNVAVLNASPFSHGTCDHIASGIQQTLERKKAKVLRIDIPRLNISPCIGCNRCAKMHDCFMHDDAQATIAKLHDADAFCIVSPVYFAGPPSQLKALFDRFQPLFWTHENGHLTKPCYLVSVGSGGDPYGHRALDICVSSAISMLGFKLCHVQSSTRQEPADAIRAFEAENGPDFLGLGKE